MLPAVEAWNLNHWTSREVPGTLIFLFLFFCLTFIHLFIWLLWVLICSKAGSWSSLQHAPGVFSCGMWILSCNTGSSCLTRDQTQAPSVEARVLTTGQPGKSLGHQSLIPASSVSFLGNSRRELWREFPKRNPEALAPWPRIEPAPPCWRVKS